ncbi:sugar kinase [Brevibacillus agri]|uniref:ROK family transcriptional regulator n=2 Tax=Brevibacillus agri TaxID=51101 RepID=A0A3M8AUX6_9BACL|nr:MULTISPECIES: ROK family transcriptional regulator [Brevibacillus]ELK41223.1 ROK family protein [Brevibacillus agri BAB-2500]EJL47454.1 transcriptional regulator/sugar kinase [Brevibacillus sp. CF112]MBG9566835.1 ROK family transcriptional regulator [Brevibacillus agri]MBY0052233.1 ROK family transcriptional regulator [Brevibacillus agri]MCG5254593.1 ROK family transcriptional regulator [Brevibacillus agri]
MKKIVKQDQDVIKQHNKLMILDIIKNKRPISRAEITKITRMSATSIGRFVSELCEEGVIRETELTSSGVGRKAIMLDIEPGALYTIGVDIEKKRISFGIMDFSETIVAHHRVEHKALAGTPAETAALICQEIRGMIARQGIPFEKVIGIGIGVPGVINYERGVVQLSSTLGWKDVAFAELIEKELGIKTVIDNDLKVKILSEYLYGSAKGSNKTALIGIGTGIGSALIINGEVFRGGSNSAGELGHTTLDPNGNLCECGKRGCLQTYIDENALILEARRVKEVTDVREVFAAARNGERWAKEIVSRTALYIGITINNIVCMYNPDTVILSGDLVENYREIVELVEEHSDQVIWEPFKGKFRVIPSELRGEAIVMGAGALAMQHFAPLSGSWSGE